MHQVDARGWADVEMLLLTIYKYMIIDAIDLWPASHPSVG